MVRPGVAGHTCSPMANAAMGDSDRRLTLARRGRTKPVVTSNSSLRKEIVRDDPGALPRGLGFVYGRSVYHFGGHGGNLDPQLVL